MVPRLQATASPDDELVRRKLVQADVFTGAFALDGYARDGLPEPLRTEADPAPILRRVCESLTRQDLIGVAQPMWAALLDCYHEHIHLEWGAILPRVAPSLQNSAAKEAAWMDHHGMGLGYLTTERVSLLLRYSAALQAHDSALGQAAQAEEELRGVLQWVN